MVSTSKTKQIGQKKAGRPTKYREDILSLAVAYAHSGDEFIDESGIKRRRHNPPLPSVEGFAVYLRLHRDTLYAHAKKHPDYQEALSYIKSAQLITLMDHGLDGCYKAKPTLHLLRVNHGMRLKKVAPEEYQPPPITPEYVKGLSMSLREGEDDPEHMCLVAEVRKFLDEERARKRKEQEMAKQARHQELREGLALGIECYEVGLRGYIQEAERLWKIAEELGSTDMLPSEIWHVYRRNHPDN